MSKHQMLITLASTLEPGRPRVVIIDLDSLAGGMELIETLKESQEPNNPFGILKFEELYTVEEIG